MFLASCVLLLSSTGLRISQHWCGDELVSVSVWGEAQPCGHADKTVDCPIHGTMNLSDKNCCDQREVKIEATEEEFLNHSFNMEIDISENEILGEETIISSIEDQGIMVATISHSPPLIEECVFKRNQRYLI